MMDQCGGSRDNPINGAMQEFPVGGLLGGTKLDENGTSVQLFVDAVVLRALTTNLQHLVSRASNCLLDVP